MFVSRAMSLKKRQKYTYCPMFCHLQHFRECANRLCRSPKTPAKSQGHPCENTPRRGRMMSVVMKCAVAHHASHRVRPSPVAKRRNRHHEMAPRKPIRPATALSTGLDGICPRAIHCLWIYCGLWPASGGQTKSGFCACFIPPDRHISDPDNPQSRDANLRARYRIA